MPIFMERHDFSAADTVEWVAGLHQEQLKIQQRLHCRTLNYWFDEKKHQAFVLIEAPDMQAVLRLHQRSGGHLPQRLIEVDPDIVDMFLRRDQEAGNAPTTSVNGWDEPALKILMLIHLFSCSAERISIEKTNAMRRAFYLSLKPMLARFDARQVSHRSGSLLLAYGSAVKAIAAARAIQKTFENMQKQVGGVLLKVCLSAVDDRSNSRENIATHRQLVERMCRFVSGQIILTDEINKLFRSEEPTRSLGGTKLMVLSPEDEKFLEKLMNYTDSNWSNANLKVADFNRSLGFSKSRLYRKIHGLTGKSPNAFIREYRLANALKLLENAGGNISEIAFTSGFASPSYFTKCFHKRFGHSPSDYRRSLQA